MHFLANPFGLFRSPPKRRTLQRAIMLGYAALLCLVFADASWANATILNQPFTAHPGDIISLVGKGFGIKPRAYIKLAGATTSSELVVIKGQDNIVVFRIPQNIAFSRYEIWIYDNVSSSSPHVFINAPRAMHFDSPDVASGAHVRVFGRNLYINNATPSATLIDTQTNTRLVATVAILNSDAYGLDIIAPNGIIAGRTYQLLVSNGYGSALADQTLLGHASGADYFSLSMPWAYDFHYVNGPTYQPGVAGTNEQDHHFFDATSDPDLAIHAKGDGVTDDLPAINAAMAQAAQYGGIVYLPAGTYKLNSTGPMCIIMQSGVVLQGHNASDTKLVFGPATPQGSSYALYAVYWAPGTQLSGLADLSLQNIDKTSQYVVNAATANGDVNRVFIQRVNWDLGSGASIFLQGDRIAIENSNFQQAINSQYPYPDGDSGIGPITIQQVSNLIFRGNTVAWASNQNSINDVTNAAIEFNHFTRSASDQIVAGPQQTTWPYVGKPIAVGDVVQRTQGRQLSLNFGRNLVVQNNIFDVSDGALKYNWDDGETILSEAGGAAPRDDAGTVATANSATVTANSKCSGNCAWNYYSNSMIIIVSGQGAGQWRHAIALTNNTFTVDKAWDVVPAAGDHFAISVPSYENVLIRRNTLQDNPIGIGMFAGSFYNVSVIWNQLTNNGGIYMSPAEQIQDSSASLPIFNEYRNIEINYNTMVNQNGNFPSYIEIVLRLLSPNTFWGASVDGVEERGNQITAKPGTPAFPFSEGYTNYVLYQDPNANYLEEGKSALIGTIFQGNSCTNCQINYLLSTGALDTVIWNANSTNTLGIQSTFLQDQPIANTTTTTSIGTIVGHD